jgi:hypothetical protein
MVWTRSACRRSRPGGRSWGRRAGAARFSVSTRMPIPRISRPLPATTRSCAGFRSAIPCPSRSPLTAWGASSPRPAHAIRCASKNGGHRNGRQRSRGDARRKRRRPAAAAQPLHSRAIALRRNRGLEVRPWRSRASMARRSWSGAKSSFSTGRASRRRTLPACRMCSGSTSCFARTEAESSASSSWDASGCRTSGRMSASGASWTSSR